MQRREFSLSAALAAAAATLGVTGLATAAQAQTDHVGHGFIDRREARWLAEQFRSLGDALAALPAFLMGTTEGWCEYSSKIQTRPEFICNTQLVASHHERLRSQRHADRAWSGER